MGSIEVLLSPVRLLLRAASENDKRLTGLRSVGRVVAALTSHSRPIRPVGDQQLAENRSSVAHRRRAAQS
jgi:hypothetical protein